MLQEQITLDNSIEKIPNSPDAYLVRIEQLGLLRDSGMIEESMCRFIRIKAAVVYFTCKMGDNSGWNLASLMGFAINEETRIPV